MRMTKKVTSIVLAVLMVVSMITVMGAVSASAYSTIGELDTAIRAGGTVVLDNDFTFNGSLYVPAGVTTEIDLAGHKLQSLNRDVIYNDGTLTIKDSVGNGQVIAQEACVVTRYGGTTTINCKSSTTFTSKDNGVFMGNGTSGMGGCTWNIKQGTFNGNIESAGYIACGIYAPNDDTWNISGGTFNITNGVGVCQRAGTVNITGGTFNVTGDGSLGKVGDSRVVVPTGTAVVYDSKANYPAQSDEDATVIKGGTFNTEQDPIAMVKADDSDPDRVTVTGGTFANDPVDYVDTSVYKVKYTNTAGKVSYKTNIDYSNVSASGTYQLLDDLTANSRIVPSLVASDVVFDLNGFTLTSTATDEAFLFSRAGSASNHNSYTIKNGTVVAAGDGVDLLANYADLTLEDVDIVANGVFGVVTNGTKTGNNITATDSSITAGSLGIYKPSNGSLTLTDTDVTGKTAVYVKSGDVTIDGGTFTGTGAAADYSYNGDGANITGDAIVIDNCNYPGGAPTVTITDGTFISENGEAVASYAGAKAGAAVPDVINNFIEGGNFSSDVTPLVVDGMMADDEAPVVPGAPFTITPDTNPLNPVETDTVSDGNLFGLSGKYLKGTLLGVQTKAHHDAVTSENGEQEAAEGNDLRFVAVLDYNLLKDADDYGFVLAKVENTKTTTNTNFNGLQVGRGAGEKYISAKGTWNTVCGTSEEEMRYGNPDDDTTAYKYVTCAVNGIDDASKIAIRFYYKKDGKTFYAKYAGHNYQYTGCTAGITAAGNVY